MGAQHVQISQRAGERAQLERHIRAATTPQRVVWRSQIVLLALDGLSSSEIASRLGVSLPTVRLWLRRFACAGASSLLHDAPGRGRHSLLEPSTMIARLRESHLLGDDGQPTSLRDAARQLGVSPATVWRAMRKQARER